MAQRVEVRWLVGDDNNAVRWIVRERMVPRLHDARPLLERWVGDTFVAPTDARTVENILYWVRGNMLFTEDPPGEELIKSPMALLDEIFTIRHGLGDCDDYVMLFGGLVLAATIPLRLVLVARHPELDTRGEYRIDHIYTEVRMDKGDWTPVDPTGTAAIGWEQTPYYLKETFDV